MPGVEIEHGEPVRWDQRSLLQPGGEATPLRVEGPDRDPRPDGAELGRSADPGDDGGAGAIVRDETLAGRVLGEIDLSSFGPPGCTERPRWLPDRFGAAAEPERIEAVIHPQSLVHCLVEFADGAVVAQLGTPDMRGPIRYALTWPGRAPSVADRLDWRTLSSLEFEEPDHDRFPALRLAYDVIEAGGTAGAVGRNWVERGGRKIELSATDTIRVRAGDVFVIETPGGGGWGS